MCAAGAGAGAGAGQPRRPAIALEVTSGACRDAPRPRRSAEVVAKAASTAAEVVAEATSMVPEVVSRLRQWWPRSRSRKAASTATER